MSDGLIPDDVPAEAAGERVKPLDIEDELRSSYLTYAMSVIVSRALPDARDGLKPSQRRILVAMNDLHLGPATQRAKCAKISGDTSGNYHPHGDAVIYPTLVRLAQPWVMRDVLIDKQGNFGSLAGLPPAAMRYTEARLSAIAVEMLDDLSHDTVDYVDNYTQTLKEPVVLPSRFPNLLVNGSSGIAVGMATSIPPHNLNEVADAVVKIIDDPDCTIDDILDLMPGPDFPTGGIICGREGIRQGYITGRSTIALRGATHFETEKNADVIVITEIPYLETRDRLKEKLEDLIREDRIKGIARVVDFTDRKTPEWQVRLHIVLKRDADRDVVLNQLFQYSPLQVTFSVILLALVGNRPQTLSILELLQEFLRHRVTVIRRRTEYLLAEARKRKHTVEGLLIAQSQIDLVIATIRNAASRADAKVALQAIEVPAELVARALGESGFRDFQEEKGAAETYQLSANQSEAIVSMQLGSLANLERETLRGEHQKLLDNIVDYLRLLSDEANIRAVVRQDLLALKEKYGTKRRTAFSEDEVADINRDDLIAEEPMVVTLSQRGYVKRTPLSTYQAQNRGGKGITGVKSDEEDDVKHLFVASTHAYLLFFTDRGRVHWQKVYDLPLQSRTSRGRAIVNLLSLKDAEERVTSCLAVREFTDEQFLIMATKNGTVKKTALSAYSRPMKGGIIAIKLDEGDELIDVRIVSGDDDVVLATQNGMSIRFTHHDARPMGRATRGVRGISLASGDAVVGLVVADPKMTLLTVCENGYGKRTPFGPGIVDEAEEAEIQADAAKSGEATEEAEDEVADEPVAESPVEEMSEGEEGDEAAAGYSGNQRYRRQRRGGKGLRDIRTTARNGKVIDIVAVADPDEVIMITARGKIQRVHASDISQIGRNTQGVRIIRLDDEDTLVSLARIPAEITEQRERPMKCLVVTGGCGFIGSNFIRDQIARYPEQSIVNIDKLTYAGNPENLTEIEGNSRYRFQHGDICDREFVQAVAKSAQPDAVVNFAAESHVDRSILDSGPFIQTNVVGTQTLLDCCREAKVARFLQVSTDEVYGSLGAEGFFTEETPIAPNSPYSASKASADLLVRAYFHTFGFPAVITRCSNNYGPYQFPEKIIPLFISRALDDKPLPVYGKGENVRDWIHVLDHCRGIDAALRQGKPGEVYNFGGHQEIRNIDLTRMLLELLGKPQTLIEYVKDRPGHDLRYAIDCSKAERELGWKPQVAFRQGIRDTIDWYKSNAAWVERIKTGDYLKYYKQQYGKE